MIFEEVYKIVVTEHLKVIHNILESEELYKNILSCAELIRQTFSTGGRVLLCGNGGSASDAQHIACEFVGRFYKERKALDAEALTINTSSLTAIGNDYSFDRIFSRQVEAKGNVGDILIGITTSGTSKNIITAFEVASSIGMKTICFTGEKAPEDLNSKCDIVLRVPSPCTPRIQESHILLGHVLCEYVEAAIADADTI